MQSSYINIFTFIPAISFLSWSIVASLSLSIFCKDVIFPSGSESPFLIVPALLSVSLTDAAWVLPNASGPFSNNTNWNYLILMIAIIIIIACRMLICPKFNVDCNCMLRMYYNNYITIQRWYLWKEDKCQEDSGKDEYSCHKYPSSNVDVCPQGECHQCQHHNNNTWDVDNSGDVLWII